jgi:adenine deaminase
MRPRDRTIDGRRSNDASDTIIGAMNEQQGILEVARGLADADLLLANAQVVNVLNGQIMRADVAILGDAIAGVGTGFRALQTIDLRGKYLLPGLIDARPNVEAASCAIAEYARLAVARGTTTIVVELADIASVCGLKGVSEMLEGTRHLPIDVFFSVPQVQTDPKLETQGVVFDQQALLVLDQLPRRVGYGGYLDCAALVQGADRADALPQQAALPLTGSAPGLLGNDLQAYIAAGVTGDDHWLSEAEADEKLAAGLWLLVQESSVVSATTSLPLAIRRGDSMRCCLVTGRRTATDLLTQGHLDHALRSAVRHGMGAMQAVRGATLGPATYFHLVQRGAIAPGYLADLVAMDDLAHFSADFVVKSGKVVVHRGQSIARPQRQRLNFGGGSIHTRPLRQHDLQVPGHSGYCRMIGMRGNHPFTDARWEMATLEGKHIVADPARDVLKVAVVERHKGKGSVGLGFVIGLGLARGAICTSFAPPTHPLVVAGADDQDMVIALSRVVEMQGGVAVAVEGTIVESLPLPVGGILSNGSLEDARERLDRIETACWELGCGLTHPALSVGALADLHLPSLRISDLGLVDTDNGAIVAIQDGG